MDEAGMGTRDVTKTVPVWHLSYMVAGIVAADAVMVERCNAARRSVRENERARCDVQVRVNPFTAMIAIDVSPTRPIGTTTLRTETLIEHRCRDNYTRSVDVGPLRLAKTRAQPPPLEGTTTARG